MIEISEMNLKIEDKTIFHNFQMKFKENQVYWLKGSNGSGKTTLFKVLAGLYLDYFRSSNNNAKILYNQKLISLSDFRNFTNYIPSEPYLFEYLTGQQNIDYLIQLFDLSNKHQSIMQMLNDFNLTSSLERMVKDYSLGMKAQLYLSVVLHRDKKIHLIDEIINSLDKLSQEIFFSFISNKVNESNTTVVITSHSQLETTINYETLNLQKDSEDKI